MSIPAHLGHMTRLLLIALTLPLLSSTLPAWADTPREPDLNRVRLTEPASHAALVAAFGQTGTLKSLAAQMKRDTPAGTLRTIWSWLRRNLRPKRTEATAYRTVEAVLASGYRTGDGEQALVFAALTRAAGIPTVWLKAVSLDSLHKALDAGGDPEHLEPRTYLEIHIANRWQLLDPRTLHLYPSHDPRQVLLPDSYIAYDRGTDPRALVLPHDRVAWQAQARAWLARLDQRTLPFGDAQDLLAPLRVYIAGAGAPARYAKATSETFGYLVEKTIDRGLEKVWARVRGKTLIVTCSGDQPHLPAAWRDKLLPPGWQDLVAGRKKPEAGYLTHKLQNGTRVILTAAQDYQGVETAIAAALTAK